jgi:hypothetical protein
MEQFLEKAGEFLLKHTGFVITSEEVIETIKKLIEALSK